VKSASANKSWFAALACALAGAAVFQFFGNATRGYIDTASLFYWWGFQWFDPRSELEHWWLTFGLSAWLFARNLRAKEAEGGRLEAGGEGTHPPASGLRPPTFAIAAMAAGLALHALGFAAQQTRLSIVALLVFAWGALRLGGGRRWGRAAMFPLGFLVFAIPFNALDSVGFWLRLWVIQASAGLAHAAGIGVLQSGTQLLAPDGRFNYDVAAACSGVRSLMALAALSLLVGYLNFRAWWRRGALLLLCFPLVYLGNVTRVAAIVFAAQWAGPARGEWVHEWFGFVVFVIVLGGVLLAAEALRRWWPEEKPEDRERRTEDRGADDPSTRPANEEESRAGTGVAEGRPYLVAAVVVALALGEMFSLHHLAALPPRGEAGVRLAADGLNPVDLPAFVGTEWIGRRTAVTQVERDILPPDTGFSRRLYVAVNDATRTVLLSLVLSGRDRTSIHRPELCVVGQGWTLVGSTERRFRFPAPSGTAPGAAGSFPATVLRVQREVATPAAAGQPGGHVVVSQLVAYWFVGGDEVVATHWQRLARDAWNRVVHARADRWAYVLVQTDARDGEAAALARIQRILDETLPVFQRPMPAP